MGPLGGCRAPRAGVLLRHAVPGNRPSDPMLDDRRALDPCTQTQSLCKGCLGTKCKACLGTRQLGRDGVSCSFHTSHTPKRVSREEKLAGMPRKVPDCGG